MAVVSHPPLCCLHTRSPCLRPSLPRTRLWTPASPPFSSYARPFGNEANIKKGCLIDDGTPDVRAQSRENDSGEAGGTRTLDTRLKRPVLCQTELLAQAHKLHPPQFTQLPMSIGTCLQSRTSSHYCGLVAVRTAVTELLSNHAVTTPFPSQKERISSASPNKPAKKRWLRRCDSFHSRSIYSRQLNSPQADIHPTH